MSKPVFLNVTFTTVCFLVAFIFLICDLHFQFLTTKQENRQDAEFEDKEWTFVIEDVSSCLCLTKF